MTRALPSLRRSARGLLAAHPLLWFVTGLLFAGQLPGEPLHSRLFLAALVILAIIAGISYEATRRGGTFDLLIDRATTTPRGDNR